MNKIILTGSSGFVGKNLINYFQQESISEIISLNLREDVPESLQPAEAIIHLAGKAHDLKKSSNPEEYYKVNFELTKRLYDVFLKSDVKKFIYISSVKAAADSVNEILTEEVIPSPRTDYGKSKLMAEEYILNQSLPLGKSFYILRPCMIHGPGNKGNLNLLYKVVKKGIPYPLASFDNKRSFLSIKNLLFVIQQIMEATSIKSGVYNLSDDLPLATNDVIKVIAEVNNTSPKLWNVPRNLIKFFAKSGDILHLPLNTERLNKLTESYQVSNEKIKKALNISSFPVSSREGLISTIKSFKS